MLEEAEAPHRAKSEALAREAEAAQAAFVALRREHEALLNSHRVRAGGACRGGAVKEKWEPLKKLARSPSRLT
jgi:hypothetical protein